MKRILLIAILALGFYSFPGKPFLIDLAAETEISSSTDEQLLGVEEEMKTEEMGEKTQKQFEEMFLAPEEFAESGSKHARRLSESPSAITVLNRDEIKAYGVSTLEELLRMVPGVQLKDLSPSYKTLGIRGFNSVGGNRILLLIDGQEMNCNFFGGIFWRLLPVSLDDIERIEVIRGPGSALYGANAFAGVINVVTENPRNQRIVTLISEVGAYDQDLGTLFFKGKVYRKFSRISYLASVDFDRTQSWMDPDHNNAQVIRARVKALYEPIAEAQIQADLGFLQGEQDFYTQFMSMRFKPKPTFYLNTISAYKDFKLQAYYRRQYITSELTTPLTLVQDNLPGFDSYMDNMEGRLEYTLKLPGRNRMTAGAGYLMNIIYSDILAKTYNDEKRFEIFLQDEWSFRKDILLTAGLRYDYNSITNQSFSPRASLIYFFHPEHNLRASFGQAFRKPSFFEYGLRTKAFHDMGPPFSEMMGNPDVKNERITTYEIGYQGRFLRRLETSLTAFFNQYRDTIVVSPGALQFTFLNEEKYADGFGSELSVKAFILPRLDGFFNYSFTKIVKRTREETYLAIEDFDPQHILNLGLRLEPLPRLLLSLSGNFVSQTRDFVMYPDLSLLAPINGNLQKLGPYFLLNFRAGYRPFSDQLEIGIKVFNLLSDGNRQFPNEIWHQPGQEINWGGEEIGRTITVFMEASF